MSIRINGVSINYAAGNFYQNDKSKKNHAQPSFNGKINKVSVNKAGLTVIGILMLIVGMCTSNRKIKYTDIVKINVNYEDNDTSIASVGEYQYNSHTQKYYHYYPKEGGVSSRNYDWVETIYPDGRVEKDSAGYKISITADGQRTSVKTEFDNNGNKVTTTISPDNSKIIHKDYKTEDKDRLFYSDSYFRSDGTLKEVQYCNEYPSDTTKSDSEKIVERGQYYYNDNGILLKWGSNIADTTRNEINNKYDSKKRLIYDDIKNETYEYKGSNKNPYRSISVKEGCERITLYNNNGNIKKVYFKASDGTITED